jgi:hypothetical protein
MGLSLPLFQRGKIRFAALTNTGDEFSPRIAAKRDHTLTDFFQSGIEAHNTKHSNALPVGRGIGTIIQTHGGLVTLLGLKRNFFMQSGRALSGRKGARQ